MRVGIGPRNTAGQGLALARALRAAGFDAESFATEQHRPPLGWPVDHRLVGLYWKATDWPVYLRGFTHLVMWNGLTPRGRWWWSDPKSHGALMFRGSELRRPDVHRDVERWSPYGEDELSERLRHQSARLARWLNAWQGPVFVATVEMLDYAPPRARWVPIIAEPVPEPAPLFSGPQTVVLHQATNGMLKGSRYVVPVSGIELRRPGMITPPQMLAAIRSADVIVGGLVLGDYGGTEIQGLAAGRIVVANVSERVRSRMPVPVPIVQADPSTITEVLRDIAAHPDDYVHLSEEGRAFHAQFHDGRYSVEQLGGFLS